MSLLPVLLILLGASQERAHLIIRAFPKMSLASPSRPSMVTITAEIEGPEDERFYCPTLTWIIGEGINRITAEEGSDCVPFEQRNEIPPIPPECRMRLEKGQIIIPACFNDERVSQGYPRRWTRRYAVGQCMREDGECWYTVEVELRKNGKKFAWDGTRFLVR